MEEVKNLDSSSTWHEAGLEKFPKLLILGSIWVKQWFSHSPVSTQHLTLLVDAEYVYAEKDPVDLITIIYFIISERYMIKK